jgi:hypothetical protein
MHIVAGSVYLGVNRLIVFSWCVGEKLGGGIDLRMYLQPHNTLPSAKIESVDLLYPDGILYQHFQSRFLGINSSLFKLEFLSGFLPSFFRSTKCYS